MLPTMVDKTDVSELAPETSDPEKLVRARFTALRDRLLETAERHAASDLGVKKGAPPSLAQMVEVARLVSAAAAANAVVETHSLKELQEQSQLEVKNYMTNFVTMLQGMEQSNIDRFAQQRLWVEEEFKARGLKPPKSANAPVFSLVPDAPPPDPAG